MKNRVLTEAGFVALKRFGWSLEKLLTRYPQGVPDRIIAQALLMTEEEVEALYQSTVQELRARMGVSVD